MCHAERQEVYDWLAAQGATPDTPEQLREKVRTCRAGRSCRRPGALSVPDRAPDSCDAAALDLAGA